MGARDWRPSPGIGTRAFLRKATLVLVILAVAGSSFCIGLLVGSSVRDPNWVEAAGTWFGVVFTASAAAIAVLVFRSEEVARHRQEAREERAGAEAQAAAAAVMRKNAGLVRASVSWSGGPTPEGRTKLREYQVRVYNHAAPDSDSATNVEYRHPTLMKEYAPITSEIRPGGGGSQAKKFSLDAPFEGTTRDVQRVLKDYELRFDFMGFRWYKRHKQPPQVQSDD